MLIRPDLAVFAAVFFVAALYVERPDRRRAAVWVAAALVVPLAFEVFRAGYYAVLVPNTALAKDASGAVWGQGLTYLGDFVAPYRLWVPLVGLSALSVVGLRRLARCGSRDRVVVFAAPVAGGLLSALYVVRVGGTSCTPGCCCRPCSRWPSRWLSCPSTSPVRSRPAAVVPPWP